MYKSPTTKDLSDFGFALSMSLKVKSDGAIWLPIYYILFLNNSIWPNLRPLLDISLRSQSDLDLDLSRSPKVKSI